jgi:hypothetical protein
MLSIHRIGNISLTPEFMDNLLNFEVYVLASSFVVLTPLVTFISVTIFKNKDPLFVAQDTINSAVNISLWGLLFVGVFTLIMLLVGLIVPNELPFKSRGQLVSMGILSIFIGIVTTLFNLWVIQYLVPEVLYHFIPALQPYLPFLYFYEEVIPLGN